MPSSCIACAKAKRRCSKQKPTCFECHSRSVECQWPQPKPSSFVLLEEEAPSQSWSAIPTTTPAQVARGSGSQTDRLTRPEPPITLDISGENVAASERHAITWWFMLPETWTIDHASEEIINRQRSVDDISYAMTKIFQWLSQWVDGDSNPFIHRQLYRHRFPQCVQDAYMVLSCYLKRKPTNAQAILQIMQDKIQRLLDEHDQAASSTSGSELSPTDADPLVQLAQVQALLVYQLIGLYDGDIRLRAIAERNMPVLIDWTHEAVDCASQSHYLGPYLLARSASGQSMENIPWEKLVWYSWILAESLRRTWLVISAIQGVYISTRDGVGRCLGGMMFTSRRGFWDAPSAFVWQQQCCDKYDGLVSLAETDKLLSTIHPADLDEFANLILVITFGEEQVERWGIDLPRTTA